MKAIKRSAQNLKSSGIEWIGGIPVEHDIVRNKYLIKFVKGKIPKNQNIEHKGVPYVGASDLDNFEYSMYTEDTDLPMCIKDDVLILWDGARAGAVGFGKEGALSSTMVKCVFDKNELYPKFWYWYLKGFENFLLEQVHGTTIPHMSSRYVNEICLINWSLLDQKNIANYLDDRCSKIDAIIAEAKASIEEYKELKQAVIYEAVTKGLDKNVEMKTYNDWFDMCPANWKYEQIRYLYELRDERNFDPLSEVNLISLYTDRGVMQHSDIEKTSGNKAVTADGYKKVYPEDIVVNIILCWMGAMGRSEYQGVTSPAYDVYKPIGESVICSRYYHYLFRTEKFSKKCYTVGRGIMMMRWRTYSSQFKAIKVPVPTYKEQVEIANYLDTRTKQIDNLVEEKQSLIADLESYKKSLIYEVVTGKRKVVA